MTVGRRSLPRKTPKLSQLKRSFRRRFAEEDGKQPTLRDPGSHVELVRLALSSRTRHATKSGTGRTQRNANQSRQDTKGGKIVPDHRPKPMC